MRKIKFRVWDKASRRYLPPHQTLIDGKSSLFRLSAGDNCIVGTVFRTGCLRRGREPELILEQYTGLKDKNGIEIYEGDVVRVKHRDWIEPTIHMVKWGGDEEYPAFDLSPEIDETMNNFALAVQSDLFSIKIIGNIHKNPELLEEK